MCLPVFKAQAQDAGTITGQGVLDAVVAAQGKVVVIDFFASWCKPCLMEIPEFIEARKHYPADKVVFIGISLDQDPGAVLPLRQADALQFPGLSGRSRRHQHLWRQDDSQNHHLRSAGQQALNHSGFMPGEMLRQILDKLIGGEK